MVYQTSIGRKAFVILNYTFLIAMSCLCLLPLVHVVALSFSSSSAATAGLVTLWPVNFTIKSYDFVLGRSEFVTSLGITLQRVALGVSTNMLLTLLCAYPLAKEAKAFRWRTSYAWFFVLTILFSGGLIPSYMVVMKTGLLDSIWALILPGAVPVFNVILLLNFFRGLPKELEESAFIDGAGHWIALWKIYIPLSAPALATISLFAIVFHWNSWFDGLIYMNAPERYPLQSYLQTVIIARDLTLISTADLSLYAEVSDRTSKAAKIFLGALPILMVYPFLQRFFMKGIVLGSVKG